MTFGEWIRVRRAVKQWTQRELADNASMNQAVLSQLERDKLRSINSEIMTSLVKVLGQIPEDIAVPQTRAKQAHPKRESRQEKFNRVNQIPTKLTTYNLPEADWLNGHPGGVLSLIKDQLGLDYLEPMVLSGCFKLRAHPTSEIVGVEFTERIMSPNIPHYFHKLGLRFAEFSEFVRFGVSHKEVWENQLVVQFGSQFKDGYNLADKNICGSTSYASGGFNVGSALYKREDVGKSLIFCHYKPLLVVLMDSYEAQQPHLPAGTIVLGVKRKATESVFLNSTPDNTVAEMRRAGLDTVFNQHLFDDAVKHAERVGRKLQDTPSLRNLLHQAYFTNTQFDLYSTLGFYPELERAG